MSQKTMPRISKTGGEKVCKSKGDYSFIFSSNLSDWQNSSQKNDNLKFRQNTQRRIDNQKTVLE